MEKKIALVTGANSGMGMAGLNVQTTATLNSGRPSAEALIIKGATNQIANLTEWQNIDGLTLSYKDSRFFKTKDNSTTFRCLS